MRERNVWAPGPKEPPNQPGWSGSLQEEEGTFKGALRKGLTLKEKGDRENGISEGWEEGQSVVTWTNSYWPGTDGSGDKERAGLERGLVIRL